MQGRLRCVKAHTPELSSVEDSAPATNIHSLTIVGLVSTRRLKEETSPAAFMAEVEGGSVELRNCNKRTEQVNPLNVTRRLPGILSLSLFEAAVSRASREPLARLRCWAWAYQAVSTCTPPPPSLAAPPCLFLLCVSGLVLVIGYR